MEQRQRVASRPYCLMGRWMQKDLQLTSEMVGLSMVLPYHLRLAYSVEERSDGCVVVFCQGPSHAKSDT